MAKKRSKPVVDPKVDDAENRMTETAIRVWKRDPDILDTIGKSLMSEVRVQTSEELSGLGISGITGGLTLGLDPVTVGVMLGFLTVGMDWPTMFPGLLKKINKRWKQETKK